MFVSQHNPDIPIKSSRFLPGWQISGKNTRTRFQSKGHIPNKDAIIHREFKAKKGKKGSRKPVIPPPYPNPKLSPWQKELALYVHQGHNVVVDVVTSCGKTWSANLITAYEILSRDTPTGAKDTALIISPNSEVMRDSVKDICENHIKYYNYSTQMLSTLTRNFSSYDERYNPNAQILVIAVECIEEFITNPVNETFVNNLKIIVFDEVHLNSVTRGLWWSQYVPHTAQLILLSATLGDADSVRETVQKIQSLQQERPKETKIIKYGVRPIALQPLVFKGCEPPKEGVISSDLKKGGKLSCIVNRFDPTVRDIKSLVGTKVPIPEDRESQYYMGQDVIKSNQELIDKKMEDALSTATTEPTAANIYSLLCYLFSNDKQPVMVFNTTSGATESLGKSLVGYISQLESKDPEFTVAQKQLKVYEKEQYRIRDKLAAEQEKKDKQGKWDLKEPEPEQSINIHEVHTKLNKWRFPTTETPDNLPQWIKDCMEYGIGVHVSTMKVWQLYTMFDAFREGRIKVLLSDSSISVGINLPIRTVIMCGHMTPTLYKQASGRAGRRGMDTQGYVVHMMEKEDIRKCLTEKVPEVYLNMPKYMNHSDLIRLSVPRNLDSYYTGTEVEFGQAESMSSYKETILNNYLNTLTESEAMRCLSQIELLRKERWHYHRLTNLIKTLPEQSSILLMKVLVGGHLNHFTSGELTDLISVLFCRDVGSEPGNDIDYYLPRFEHCPDMYVMLQKYSKAYGIDIDFTRPVHRYFSDFCRKQIVHMDHLNEIIQIGEWVYIFKRGLSNIVPMEPLPKRDRKEKKKYREPEPIDPFTRVLYQVDRDYMAARAYRSV